MMCRSCHTQAQESSIIIINEMQERIDNEISKHKGDVENWIQTRDRSLAPGELQRTPLETIHLNIYEYYVLFVILTLYML